MSAIEIIATIVGGLTIGTALMVVISRHPIRSVLYLILTFFMISANYVLLSAQFLAIVNIMVYAGAIMVLFLFVLMLLNPKKETEPVPSNLMRFAAVIAGCVLAIVLVAALKHAVFQPIVADPGKELGLVKDLGMLLFSKYVFPFEVSSILFIAAMVGSVLLSKKEKEIIG